MIEIAEPDFDLTLKQIGDNTHPVVNHINSLGMEEMVFLAVNEESLKWADMVKNLLAFFYNVSCRVEMIRCQALDDGTHAVYDVPIYPRIRRKSVVILNSAVDSGDSVLAVQDYLDFRYHNIRAMKVGAMAAKPTQTIAVPELTTFKIPQSSYAVGFGLEYNGKYHELEGIRSLTPAEKKEKKIKKPAPRMTMGIGGPGRIVKVKK